MNNNDIDAFDALEAMSAIANNPKAQAGDVIGPLSNIPQSSLDNITSSLGTMVQTPTVTGLNILLSDSINSFFNSSSAPNVSVSKVNYAISSALDSLRDSSVLSDSKLSNITSEMINLSLFEISNKLIDSLGSSYSTWALTNQILDQLGSVFNNIQLVQSSPHATSYQAEQCPPLNLTGSDLALNSLYSAAAVDADSTETRKNPSDPTAAPGQARPNDRPNTPIGVEPAADYKGRYPYNKAYRSEGGHIIEIDDTPGAERLLDQHTSGTYQEMTASGDHVIKVVGSNYTAVAGDDSLSVEGDAKVYVRGSCRLHIGGAITIVADGGLNIVSKGDFRVKAKSINLESISGDVNIKSAQDTLITTNRDYHLTSKTNQIDSSDTTSMIVGGNMSVEAAALGVSAKGPITAIAGEDLSIGGKNTYVHGSGDTNILADGKVINSGSSVEIDGDLNVKQTTNMKAGSTSVVGQGCASGAQSSSVPPPTTPAKSSHGSSINYSPDPNEEIMANDDDPDALGAAIQRGIQNGTISLDYLKSPGTAVQSDTDQKDNRVAGNNNISIKDIGPTPPDNLMISPHYKLFDLTKGARYPHAICAQHGLTVSQIAGNLQLVAVNILEKVRQVYPDVVINSAFRPGNSKSQHERGMAVDMQFRNGSTPERCMQIAQWIKSNIAFDQLILEYSSPSRCWVHCSYNKAGNRPWSNSTKVLTMYGGKYTPGLHRY